MKRIISIIVFALAAFCLVAAGGDVLTGEDLAPGTINGDQVGTSVTYVKAANVAVQPAEFTAEDADCRALYPDPLEEYEYCAESREGAGQRTVTLNCPSGNVASGSLVYNDAPVMLEESYPVSDHGWRFVILSEGRTAVTVQARVVCL